MLKKTLALSGLLIAGGLVSQSALADLSANIGVTSNYVWRGQTQTNDQAAISGGLDYSHSSGLYVGTWASNVDFSTVDGTGAVNPAKGYELDFYGGYSGSYKDFGYDVGYIRYTYPTLSGNVGEYYVSGSYKNFSLKYSADSAESKNNYLEAAASFDLPKGASLGLHVGKYNKLVSADEYKDYSVSLSKDDFTLTVSDTDITNDPYRVYVSWSKSFDL